MKHILIIPSWYKSRKNKTYGSFIYEQARMLYDANMKIGVLYPMHIQKYNLSKESQNNFDDNGIFTIYSTTRKTLPTRYGDWFAIRRIRKNAFREFNNYCNVNGVPDVIHSHSVFYGGICAKYISEKSKIPFIHTEHLSKLINSYEYDRFPYYKEIFSVLASASARISVSSFQKSLLVNKYGVKDWNVISNPINSIFFENVESREMRDTFNLINIGALNENKNQVCLIEAISILKEKYQLEINLIIVGRGPYKNRIIDKLNENNLTNNVTIYESCSREEIKRLINISHLLVSTSKFETFGLTIAEAIGVGRPVVVLDSGGPKDFVSKSNGIIVKEQSPESIASAIRQVINNYRKYNSNKISLEMKDKFHETIFVNKLNEIYESIKI